MYPRLLALLGASFTIACPAFALAAVDAVTTTLTNGLTVIVAPEHAAPVATVGVLYKVGSRNETPWTTGVAHQVEHMMFKGTTDLLKPGDIDRRFIDNNASTDQDSTYYYESFQKDGLEGALQIEADRMLNAAMDPVQLASENVVVLSELEAGDNSASNLLDEQVEATAMQAHQYHWPVIGWKPVVETFGKRRDLVYDFYVHHYAPQNAVLVIAGDVDPNQALALVHKHFDTLAQRPVTPLEAITEPRQNGVRRVNLRGPGSSDRIEMAWHVPGAYTDDGYVFTVLDAVLALGQSSRLYQALVEGGYAAELSTAPNTAVDPYIYTISAPLERRVTHDKARTIIEAALRKLANGPISDAELAKAKKQIVAASVFGHDGVEALAQQLAFWQAWTGDWRNDERFVARIRAVTAAQVRDTARRFLTPDNLTIGMYTATANAAAGSSNVNAVPRSRNAVPRSRSRVHAQSGASAISAQASPPARFVLDNGLVLIVQENHVNPSAVIETNTAAGSAFDPAAKSGLAALTQEMMMRSAGSYSYEALQAAIDALGISINAATAVSGSTLSTQTLAEDEPKAMAILAEMLLHPAFGAAEFKHAQEQLVSERRNAQDNPSVVARQELYRNLYPASSPWSRPSEGTAAGLSAVRLPDVKSFYETHYGPNNTLIVVTGDVKAAAVRAHVERLFGAWRRVTAQRPDLVGAPRQVPVTRTVVAVMPGKSQVDVYAGAAGLPPDAPDFHAAQLMNFILGGESFISKLLHQVRDVDGYVYGIGSRFTETAGGEGPWLMQFGSNPRNVNNAIAEAVNQMRSLQRDRVTEEELAQYRRLAADAVITGELSNQGQADELMRDELLGRGLDYTRRLPALYAAVTAAQIQAAAQKYLRPDSLMISAAGPKY